MSDKVEFYENKQQRPFLTVNSAFQPNDGDLVSIRGETFTVLGRSFAVDYADSLHGRSMRCNVIVKKVKP